MEQYITLIFLELVIFHFHFQAGAIALQLGTIPHQETKFHLFIRAIVYKTTTSLQQSQSKMWMLVCPRDTLTG